MKTQDWVKHWHGSWSLLSCSFFGQQYTKTLSDFLGVSLRSSVLLVKEGFSSCFFPEKQLTEFSQVLAENVVKDKLLVTLWCEELKKRTDYITSVIQRHKGKFPVKDDFDDFKKALYDYASPHIAIKKVVDALPKSLLHELLPQLEEARLYSEKVYTLTEEFMVALAEKVSKSTFYPKHLILSMVKEELDDYIETGNLPSKDLLEKRFQSSALLFEDGDYTLVSGEKSAKVEEQVLDTRKDQLKGQSAFSGKVKGRVRIVHSPDEHDLKHGEILVTGMTRPEFLPLVEIASGIITDAGGILCHAAITAREMKKPCIVGTVNATKVLMTGDMVELDAETGIIKKIK